MATQKVTIEIPLELLLAEQKLVRAAYALNEHMEHSVARKQFRQAVETHRKIVEKTGEID